MMEELTASQRADIVKNLAAQRDQLLKQMHEQIRQSGQAERFDRLTQLKDPGDFSVADLARDMELDQLDRETEQLRAVEDAELRIQRGTYGHCVDCGLQINPKRLLAQPIASRCTDCQELYERNHQGRISNRM